MTIPFFQIFLLLLASQHDDIGGVAATENIFCENEFCIIKDKDKSKFMIFKSSYSHSYTLCYICINGTFLTSFLVMSCLVPFIWKLIDHKFLNNIFFLLKGNISMQNFPKLSFYFASSICIFWLHRTETL